MNVFQQIVGLLLTECVIDAHYNINYSGLDSHNFEIKNRLRLLFLKNCYSFDMIVMMIRYVRYSATVILIVTTIQLKANQT